jgi:hypothetical protein
MAVSLKENNNLWHVLAYRISHLVTWKILFRVNPTYGMLYVHSSFFQLFRSWFFSWVQWSWPAEPTVARIPCSQLKQNHPNNNEKKNYFSKKNISFFSCVREITISAFPSETEQDENILFQLLLRRLVRFYLSTYFNKVCSTCFMLLNKTKQSCGIYPCLIEGNFGRLFRIFLGNCLF